MGNYLFAKTEAIIIKKKKSPPPPLPPLPPLPSLPPTADNFLILTQKEKKKIYFPPMLHTKQEEFIKL